MTFRMFASFDVCVRQLVHQHHGGFSRENGIDIHLGKNGALVLDLLAQNGSQLRD